MSVVLLISALAGSSASGDGFNSTADAAQALSQQMQTGTLLVSKGDCLAVKIFTQSPYTHVAAVVIRNGQPFVYDASGGVGTRCQTLANYLASQSPDVIHLFQPKKPFSKKRNRRFEKHLDSQLGRPYAIKHHLTGKRADGIHCAEYVTDALMAAHVIHANQPSKVSPASLVEGITDGEVYTDAKTIRVTKALEPHLKATSWCAQLWLDTKQCTSNSCVRVKRWIFCK